MNLHEDLRSQAWHLAKREPRRPRQGSLRRAVSTAYYALFHLLIAESTAAMIGSSAARGPYRNVIGRGFSHRSMLLACRSFGSGTLPDKIRTTLSAAAVIPPRLSLVAQTFVLLQEQRHRADYSLGDPFVRSEAVALLQ